MRIVFQLLRLPFLTPYSLLLLYRAKKKHGDNLCFLLKFAAYNYGNKIAITDGTTYLNFKQLYDAVQKLSYVIDTTIKPRRESVAILICNNTVNHVLVLYAIQNLGIKLILVNDKSHPNDIAKIINKQGEQCFVFASASSIENTIDLDKLVAESQITEGKLFSKNFARLIFPTSGTTGDAKLIEKKTGEFYWLQSFTDLIHRTSIDKSDVVYISIPIAHGFGYTALLFTMILGKKALVTGGKNMEQVANLLLYEKADLLAGVPTVLYKVAERLEGTKHSVRSIISGGAAMNETIFNKLTNTLTKHIFSMYGSTEGSSSFIAGYSHLSQHIYALGTPLKGVSYRLQPLPNGAKELLIKSSLSNTNTDTGWLPTGDLVEEDVNGNIIWCSRKDDMIIKNGVNIYPVEIEQALLRIDDIEDAYVTGEKDEVKGEIIIVFVKKKLNSLLNEKDLKESLRQVLPGIKIPDKIFTVGCFEYSSTGKKIKTAFLSRAERF